MAGRNPDRSSVNIVDIVRRVVTTMNNLDSTNTSTPTNDVQSENNPSQRIRSCDEEVNDSFRLPRNGQPAQRQNGPVRSRNGRFAPYRNREKKADDSKKASHIMKDVCLLPSPDWDLSTSLMQVVSATKTDFRRFTVVQLDEVNRLAATC